MAEQATTKVASELLPAEQANPASSDAVAPAAAGQEGDAPEQSKKGGELQQLEIAPSLIATAKKEAKRLERLAKAAAKTPVAPTPPSSKKEKKEKEKKEVAPAVEWVNTTPKGEKKGQPSS